MKKKTSKKKGFNQIGISAVRMDTLKLLNIDFGYNQKVFFIMVN